MSDTPDIANNRPLGVEIVSTWIRFGKRSHRLKRRELCVVETGVVLRRSNSVPALKAFITQHGYSLMGERSVTEQWEAGNPNPTITDEDLKLEGFLSP